MRPSRSVRGDVAYGRPCRSDRSFCDRAPLHVRLARARSERAGFREGRRLLTDPTWPRSLFKESLAPLIGEVLGVRPARIDFEGSGKRWKLSVEGLGSTHGPERAF